MNIYQIKISIYQNVLLMHPVGTIKIIDNYFYSINYSSYFFLN